VIVICGQLLKLIPTHINKVVKNVMVMTSIVLVYGVQLVSSMVSTMILENQTKLVLYKEIPKGFFMFFLVCVFSIHIHYHTFFI
jgi:hypothetical protein